MGESTFYLSRLAGISSAGKALVISIIGSCLAMGEFEYDLYSSPLRGGVLVKPVPFLM
jgi:hypothetical protein